MPSRAATGSTSVTIRGWPSHRGSRIPRGRTTRTARATTRTARCTRSTSIPRRFPTADRFARRRAALIGSLRGPTRSPALVGRDCLRLGGVRGRVMLVDRVAAGDQAVRHDRGHQQAGSGEQERGPESLHEGIAERSRHALDLRGCEAERSEAVTGEDAVLGALADRLERRGAGPRVWTAGAKELLSCVVRIAPSTAMPSTPPTSRLVLVIAEPRPARSRPTLFITAAVIGAMVAPIP